MFFFFNFSYTPYVAIIGDIKNSKKIVQRKEVQSHLAEVLENVNVKYKQDISSKFLITLGDEFQGLLHYGRNILNIIQEIQRDMYPVEIRFGIGVGEISTDINYEMSIGADGPGYYMAREAINDLKIDEQRNKTQSSDLKIKIEGDESGISKLINVSFSLLHIIESRWSDRQREFIYEIEKNGGSQSECAKRLNVTQSSFQRGLKNADYYAYKDAVLQLGDILEGIRNRNV